MKNNLKNFKTFLQHQSKWLIGWYGIYYHILQKIQKGEFSSNDIWQLKLLHCIITKKRDGRLRNILCEEWFMQLRFKVENKLAEGM